MTAATLLMALTCWECRYVAHPLRLGRADFQRAVEYAAEAGLIDRQGSGEAEALWRIAKRESGGDWLARNGQHFGLFQRAERVHGQEAPCPVRQIEWYVATYLERRYDGSARKALEHLRRFGWQ
jgi:hypothetical protein